MMQISLPNLLRVIFMLSTIVAVTDCCSSRILFLKEQTFNIIQQHKMQQFQQYNNNNNNNNEADATNEQKFGQQQQYSDVYAAEHHQISLNRDEDQIAEVQVKDRPPPLESDGGGGGGATSIAFPDFGKQLSELFLTDTAAAAGKQQTKKLNENPGYQLIDIYQSIMDNVLSFACTGQFLTDFCLNGGRCFRVPMGNQSLFSCECADGYVGERCESKSVNGVFVPTSALDNRKPKILTARIVFSFPMLIFLTVVYLFFGMAIVFKCQPPFRAKYPTQTPSRAAGLLFT